MKGITLHPLRLAALDRMKVLRVPMTNLGNVKLVERATPADWNAGRAHPNMRRFEDWKDKDSGALFFIETGSVVFVPAPYAPGDYFVKETWCCEVDPLTSKTTGKILYKADGQEVMLDDGDGSWAENKDGTFASPWRSPMHMKEEDSRYIVTLGNPVPCRLGEVRTKDIIREGYPVPEMPELPEEELEIIRNSGAPDLALSVALMNRMDVTPPKEWHKKTWARMYPKHTDPGTWTWGYPMEVRR